MNRHPLLPLACLLLLAAGCSLPGEYGGSPGGGRPAPNEPGPADPAPSAPWEGADAAPPSGPDAVDAEIADFGEFMNSRPDVEGVLRRIRSLGELGDPRVAAALAPLLDAKHLEVRIAAADWIGRQGDPSVAEDLVRRTKLPRVQGEPRLLAAVIGALGDADAEGRHDRLLRIAREYAASDARVAAAAYRAYARVADGETVGVLVKDMDGASPEVAAAVEDLLQRLTGEFFEDRADWGRWWRDHRKNWSARGKARPRMAPLRVEDAGGDEGGWAWERPGPDWVIASYDDGQPRSVIALVAPRGREAWAALSILDAKTFAMKPESAWAAEAAAAWSRAYRGPSRFRPDAYRVASSSVPRGRKVFLLTTVEPPDLPADRREELQRIRASFRVRK